MKKNLHLFLWVLIGAALFPRKSLAIITGGTFLPINPGLPDPVGGVYGIIHNLLMWLLAMFGVLGVLGFVLSGIFYLTAAGDEGQIKKAKSIATNSIVGIIVGLSGVIIVQAIQRMLEARYTF